MNILICNERFLFRFGVDRVLIILGKGLKEAGHTVSIMANRYDREIVQTFASQIINVPTNDDDYLNLNEHTADWLQSSWDQLFNDNTKPDIVVVGGWPFFSSIPFFNKVSQKVIFMDCGAVPLQGYSGGALITQKKLRTLRKHYLQETSLIIAISDFIADSQSKIDSNGRVPVKSILLGSDHVDKSIWEAKLLLGQETHEAIHVLDNLRFNGRQTILNLGRWEANCYKNSEASFDIIQRVKKVFPKCALLILEEVSNIRIPPALRDSIFPIGFPDDNELCHIMKCVDIGISVSLWEGFNLPLTEMQWLNRPALAFDLAAHPEVILHPWYLCTDNSEMAGKVCNILSGRGPDAQTRNQSLEKFHRYFRWSRFVQEYCEIFEELTKSDKYVQEIELMRKDTSISLVVDVTNSTRDPANSGVIRVTRRFCRELQSYTEPIFVVWDHETHRYVLPTRKEYQQLSQFNGPLLNNERQLSSDEHKITLDEFLRINERKSTWLLITETINENHAQEIRRYAKDSGIRVAAIFHDAIPILRPDLCNDEVSNNHGDYMRGLAECELVLPISNYSAQCLADFWNSNKIDGCAIFPNANPGEFGGYVRNQQIQSSPSGAVRILCVSTLEPRKNHLRLVRACLILQEKYPDLNWFLTLVGNRYAGAFEIADTINAITEKNPRISWLGIVDDAALHRLYEEATFTVYPSIIEGFGLPIMESLWHGRPCICYHEGVMAELAADGGCLTTDVMNEQVLSDTIYRLASDKELFLRLSEEAITRKIKTWNEYTDEFLSILESQSKSIKTNTFQSKVTLSKSSIMDNRGWQEILYEGCLCDNWQMNHSETLAITALLSRHKPRCSIEVGTCQGGSLLLISQYSEMVFSIDIDPSIPEKYKQFINVSFLTGLSSVVLPLLLKELDEAGIPVDFILIDGGHSAEGIKRDINIVLSYVPKKPLFVMMHDSFNPECRRGMLESSWEKSPYVQWIDIDFIPGRIVEHGGGGKGEMWGGIAMAYLTPIKRDNALVLNTSAEMMFKKLRDTNIE